MPSTETSDTYLVEQYWAGVDPTEVPRAAERVYRAVQDLTREGAWIRVLISTFIPSDEAVLTLFEASREADVVEVHVRSGVRFDRLQAVEVSHLGCKESST